MDLLGLSGQCRHELIHAPSRMSWAKHPLGGGTPPSAAQGGPVLAVVLDEAVLAPVVGATPVHFGLVHRPGTRSVRVTMVLVNTRPEPRAEVVQRHLLDACVVLVVTTQLDDSVVTCRAAFAPVSGSAPVSDSAATDKLPASVVTRLDAMMPCAIRFAAVD